MTLEMILKNSLNPMTANIMMRRRILYPNRNPMILTVLTIIKKLQRSIRVTCIMSLSHTKQSKLM